jgi:hypothetical protein
MGVFGDGLLRIARFGLRRSAKLLSLLRYGWLSLVRDGRLSLTKAGPGD